MAAVRKEEEEKIDSWLSSQRFFHGYLAREDLPSLLQNHGDFLIRCNEAEKGQQNEIVVSVLHDPDGKCMNNNENKLESTRNIIVQTATANKEKKYFFDSREKFSSLEDLITHYTENPITVNQAEVTLKRAIRLAKWEYLPQAVQVGNLITSGSYCEIREGKLTRHDGSVIDVAVKMRKSGSDAPKIQVKDMVKEARLMRGLNHTNILHCYGVCILEQPVYIIIELLSGGPLDVYLQEHKDEVKEDEKLQMIMSVAWGLEYLHSKEILHRDIVARNCFYNTKVVKIGEFSLSRQGTVYSMKTARKMPIKWMAAESIRTFIFTQKSDVYTYGVLIYEVFACEEPYSKLTTTAAKDAILNGSLNEFPQSTPKKLVEYVKGKIWQSSPENRPDMQQVVKWMQSFTGLTLIRNSDT